MDRENSNIPFEEQVKSAFEREYNEAGRTAKKDILLRIFRAIQSVIESSAQAVQESKKVGGGVVPAHALAEKEAAAQPLLQLFHFLTGNAGRPMDQELFNDTITEAGLSASQTTFIQNLASQRANANTAAFLGGITGKALEDPAYLRISAQGGRLTELEEDYKQIKRNPSAVTNFQRSMIKLAEAGQLLDTNGNPVTVEVVMRRFPDASPDEDETTTEAMILQQRESEFVKNLQNTFEPQDKVFADRHKQLLLEKEQISHDVRISIEDKKAQLELINVKISDADVERIRLNNTQNAIDAYLRYGETLLPPFAEADDPEGAIKEYLRFNLGMTNAAIDAARADMDRYQSVLANDFVVDERFSSYHSLINKVTKMLTKEEIIRRIWKNKKIDEEAVNELQYELEDEVSALFAQLYTSPKSDFNEVFSSYVEGNALKTITTALRARIEAVTKVIATDLKTGPDAMEAKKAEDVSREIRDKILKERLVGEIERRPVIERIVHTYQQQGSQIEVDKLLEILRTYDITTLQEFYKDETTLIVSDLLPGFVQQLHMTNGNNVISNLFQIVQEEHKTRIGAGEDDHVTGKQFVVKYRQEFIDYAYDIMLNMYRSGTLKNKPNKDRLSARFSRAFLDNFLLSLRSVKVISNAEPTLEAFDDIPFWHIIKGVYNPLHNWGKLGLRGRGAKGIGDAETAEIAGMRNFLYDEEAYVEMWKKKHGTIYDDYHPKEEMDVAKKRILFNIFPQNDELMNDLESGRWDCFQTMLDVYGGMAFGNIIDQAGWTFKGLNDNRNDLMKNVNDFFKDKKEYWDDSDWNERFQVYYKTVGVIPAFWLTGERSSEETDLMFGKYLAGVTADMSPDDAKIAVARYKSSAGTDGYRKKLEEYTDGKNKFKKIFDVTHGGKEKKMTHRDFANKRLQSLRGEVFHQLLLKDPQSWLGELVQHYPNLVEGYVNYEASDGTKMRMKGSRFYFDLDEVPDSELSAKDREKRDRFRFKILTQFRGKEEDRLSNVPHIKKILNFYAHIEDEYTGTVATLGGEPLTGDEAKVHGMNLLAKQLAFARRKAVKDNQAEINKSDVLIRNEKADVVDDRLYRLMYGEEGLVTHFEVMVGEKSDYFGDGGRNLGEDNGFYQRWGRFEKTNRRILPEGDTNMEILTNQIENKQALERRLATDKAFIDAQAVMDGIPGVLDDAAGAKDFDQWYGVIMKEIHDKLKVIAGEDQGIEQQYQMQAFTAVCNYFMTDSVAREFLGFVKGASIGSDISISNRKTDATDKFVLTIDRIFLYSKMLREGRYLKDGYNVLGGFGLDTAQALTGANFITVVSKQFGYAALGAPILIILAAAKSAYDSEVEDSGQ